MNEEQLDRIFDEQIDPILSLIPRVIDRISDSGFLMQIARAHRLYLNSLIEVGFSREEALEILKSHSLLSQFTKD